MFYVLKKSMAWNLRTVLFKMREIKKEEGICFV